MGNEKWNVPFRVSCHPHKYILRSWIIAIHSALKSRRSVLDSLNNKCNAWLRLVSLKLLFLTFSSKRNREKPKKYKMKLYGYWLVNLIYWIKWYLNYNFGFSLFLFWRKRSYIFLWNLSWSSQEHSKKGILSSIPNAWIEIAVSTKAASINALPCCFAVICWERGTFSHQFLGI